MEKRCPVDGVVFEAKYVNRLYCSDRCKKRANRHGLSGTLRAQAVSADPASLRPVPNPDEQPMTADEAALATRILRMRLTGATPEGIARAVKLSEDEVAGLLSSALQAASGLLGTETKHRQTLESARLDVMESQVWSVLRGAIGDDPAAPRDPQTVLAATDRLLRIQERRGQLSAGEPRAQVANPLRSIKDRVAS